MASGCVWIVIAAVTDCSSATWWGSGKKSSRILHGVRSIEEGIQLGRSLIKKFSNAQRHVRELQQEPGNLSASIKQPSTSIFIYADTLTGNKAGLKSPDWVLLVRARNSDVSWVSTDEMLKKHLPGLWKLYCSLLNGEVSATSLGILERMKKYYEILHLKGYDKGEVSRIEPACLEAFTEICAVRCANVALLRILNKEIVDPEGVAFREFAALFSHCQHCFCCRNSLHYHSRLPRSSGDCDAYQFPEVTGPVERSRSFLECDPSISMENGQTYEHVVEANIGAVFPPTRQGEISEVFIPFDHYSHCQPPALQIKGQQLHPSSEEAASNTSVRGRATVANSKFNTKGRRMGDRTAASSPSLPSQRSLADEQATSADQSLSTTNTRGKKKKEKILMPKEGSLPETPERSGSTISPTYCKTSLCLQFRLGFCKRTSRDCKFAHSMKELRATSNKYKTKICTFHAAGFCKIGNACRHAHGEEELRRPDQVENLPKFVNLVEELLSTTGATTTTATTRNSGDVESGICMDEDSRRNNDESDCQADTFSIYEAGFEDLNELQGSNDVLEVYPSYPREEVQVTELLASEKLFMMDYTDGVPQSRGALVGQIVWGVPVDRVSNKQFIWMRY